MDDTYEDQKEVALQRATVFRQKRIPKFLRCGPISICLKMRLTSWGKLLRASYRTEYRLKLALWE
jgi:hypothetical protein